ncbi:class I SAM-dependent methyltransferase [Uliginosibacterium sediminicola]|uniref:Methyltransferase domain-containing protein n=1 Tax=Uliginosibacterium sediminicola TaxID=2024550 RepID=A0ABU9Z357_9RHOO
MSEQQRIAHYEQAYQADAGFESVMVHYRQRMLLERLRDLNAAQVVEIGCGTDLLCDKLDDFARRVRQWLIVEPAADFVARARALSARPQLIQAFAEEAVDAVRQACAGEPELIICSSLLHEVPDAAALLAALRRMCGPHTRVHINVPNAASMHRRLARSMGLIDSIHALSARNQMFQQARVFDAEHLRAVSLAAGFKLLVEGGYFLKPFTHAQMDAISGVATPAVLDGLYALGKEMPELAAEIFVELQPA